jgi:hypothetical protein
MQGGRRVTSYRLSKPPASTSSPQELEGLQQKRLESPEMSPPSQPVNTDDVLDMHLFLKNFNGDFRRLFAEVE